MAEEPDHGEDVEYFVEPKPEWAGVGAFEAVNQGPEGVGESAACDEPDNSGATTGPEVGEEPQGDPPQGNVDGNVHPTGRA